MKTQLRTGEEIALLSNFEHFLANCSNINLTTYIYTSKMKISMVYKNYIYCLC